VDDVPFPELLHAPARKICGDIIYYYGEDSNITALFGHQLPDIPAGYDFDFINADALKNRLAVAGKNRHGDRHELSRPGARPQQSAYVFGRAAEDPRPGEGRRGRWWVPNRSKAQSVDNQAEFKASPMRCGEEKQGRARCLEGRRSLRL